MKHLGYSELTKRLYILPTFKNKPVIDITDDVKEYIEYTTPNPPPLEAIVFAKWIGFRFFYDDETELWETIPEGKTYDFNGQKQFRFSTEELYRLYLLNKEQELKRSVATDDK